MGYPASEDYLKLGIKFSFDYQKLFDAGVNNGDKVMLESVKAVHLEDLGESFMEYDTRIIERGKTARLIAPPFAHFPLPKKGAYILLKFIFLPTRKMFSTLRRYTPNKFEYYSDNIGETFTVKIEAI